MKVRTANGGLLLVLLSAFPAAAMGPVVTAGGVVTLQQTASSASGTTVTINSMAGPAARVGFELGDRWNHEISVQWTYVSGAGAETNLTSSVPVSVMTLAGSYTFSVDLFTKEGLDALPGFTPSIGVGLAVGGFQATAGDLSKWGPYLEFHAMVGARYTLKNGWNFRLEAVASTYGGFFAVQPSLGAGYRF